MQQILAMDEEAYSCLQSYTAEPTIENEKAVDEINEWDELIFHPVNEQKKRKPFKITQRLKKTDSKAFPLMKAPNEEEHRKEWTLDDFVLKERIGRGNFGNVYRAKERTTGFPVALKIMARQKIIEDLMVEQLRIEIEVQSLLSTHEHVLKLYGFFWTNSHVYLVLEYASGGMLHHAPKSHGVFREQLAGYYTYQMATALKFAHENNVIHRDMKPENVLLDSEGKIKIADFGWSAHGSIDRRKTMCGTLDFLAPEICLNKSYGKGVDVWALGVMTYEMLCGKPPFESTGEDASLQTKRRIVSGKYSYPNHRIGILAKHFIKQTLNVSPRMRINMTNVLRHPWIRQFEDKHRLFFN